MSTTSHEKKPTPLLADSTYNRVKKSATIVLPAFGTLYFALAQIWGLPKAEEVMGSIAALNTCLGVLVQVSKKSYYASGTQYAGAIEVGENGLARIVFEQPPVEVISKTQATFKITEETGENPVIRE